MRELRVKFKITKALNQIDWDSEIVNPDVTDMTDDELGKIASKAVMRYQLALMHFGKGIEELEPYRQANILRILQYFYGLFIYYHGAFRYYNFSCRIFSQNNFSFAVFRYNVKDFTPDMKDLMKKYGKLERSELPLEKIIEVQAVFDEILDNQDKEERKQFPDGGFVELQKLFKKCGLEVVEPTIANTSGDHGAIVYDGIILNEVI